MPLPTRDEIPAAERWDPSLVFESPEAWEAAADELADRIPAVAAYEGRATTDGETLLELLQSVEEIKVRRLGRLWLYATMTRAVDTTDETARDRHARYRELRERLDDAVSFLAPAVRRAGRDRIETFVETTPGLERYESYLDRLLVGSECVVPAAATEAVSALETAAGGGSRVARAIRENDLTHATITWNGEQVTVTDERRAELLHRGDRETRRAAYEAHRDALTPHRHGRAAAFTERLRALDRLAEIRGYDSPLAMHLDGWATTQAGPFPRAAYETVIEGVTERPDPRSRLMAARSDAVGGQLRPWDRDLSVVSGDPPTVHYEEATDLILAALDPLGESYVDRARKLLAERRVDVRPTRHKRDGGKAAMLAAAGERPFLELRYDGTLRALYLFVHELGHALHRSLA
ncbi:MAG: M3 family metallopeptidase, partial [Halobaculum sp.]